MGELIKQYSEFIQFPIRLWQSSIKTEEVISHLIQLTKSTLSLIPTLNSIQTRPYHKTLVGGIEFEIDNHFKIAFPVITKAVYLYKLDSNKVDCLLGNDTRS